MSVGGRGQIRRSQVITTYGPGALIDLPRDSAIIAGLEAWPGPSRLHELNEPRLERRLRDMTGVAAPRLYAPPTRDETEFWRQSPPGITAWRFPEWFVVQVDEDSRPLVHRDALDERRRYGGKPTVPTRFVRACPSGHVDDIQWSEFVHRGRADHVPRLTLEESGATGELGNLWVRCACGKSRRMSEAADISTKPLGACRGKRPWLGSNTAEDCGLPGRLLIRTATNAYFPMVVRALSLPERGDALDQVVNDLWDDLQIVEEIGHLGLMKKKPAVADALGGFEDEEVLEAILRRKAGGTQTAASVKSVELDALLNVEEGYGDGVPINLDFHARKLPGGYRSERFPGLDTVVQVHRLREVLALAGFTRLEAPMPDIDGEYRDDVKRADLAIDPSWFPAVENRGEGVFLHFSTEAVRAWRDRPGVKRRVADLERGHDAWAEQRKNSQPFPGGPYVMLHTLSHLLLQSLSTHCGYPAASIRERIYVDARGERYGLLLYTASPDAEGTLGGLVQQARDIEIHLERALEAAELCSNDPVCAQHRPSVSVEDRLLHGAACHGCTLIAETSCEMWNDYLDRALVVPTLDVPDAAFFEPAAAQSPA
jgi:hypothetical protein